ncbi:MAG TPA: hypothetical protein VHD32_18275 [Candidatus Didemnitutus sp.]|nr:hypothetical protein [Candidatus Didemnitutus sp.]
MRFTRLLPALLLIVPLFLRADGDPAAATQKQIQDLERQQKREMQKVDQAEEQDRIKLRARERDELAKVQRDTNAAAASVTAGVVTTGTTAGFDPAKFAQLKFAEDEVHNLILNQLGPEITAKYDRQRKEIDRKYGAQRAKLEIPAADPGDDSSKQQHDLASKTADLNANYQEKYDNLDLEQAQAEAKVRFEHTTKVNAAERDLAALVNKHAFDATQKGGAVWNPMTDPDYAKLTAARDQAKSDLETALDEVRAQFKSKRTDIDNAKEDDTAKLSGSQ